MNIIIRKAIRSDIPLIVRLLADDNIGVTREKYEEPLPQSYYSAFDIINTDINNWLIVVELDNKIVGTMNIYYANLFSLLQWLVYCKLCS
jgi:hypothetical protein